MSATCRSCQADILWAEHHKTGRRMPLNTDAAEPFARGSFTVVKDVAYAGDAAISLVSLNEAVSFARARDLLEQRAWHTSHFATCPQAETFRGHR